MKRISARSVSSLRVVRSVALQDIQPHAYILKHVAAHPTERTQTMLTVPGSAGYPDCRESGQRDTWRIWGGFAEDDNRCQEISPWPNRPHLATKRSPRSSNRSKQSRPTDARRREETGEIFRTNGWRSCYGITAKALACAGSVILQPVFVLSRAFWVSLPYYAATKQVLVPGQLSRQALTAILLLSGGQVGHWLLPMRNSDLSPQASCNQVAPCFFPVDSGSFRIQ